MQGTAEEVKFGDMIVLDLSEDLKNGHVKHHHLDCRFIPQIVSLLVEQGVIEVKNVKNPKNYPKPEQKETLDFTDDCSMIDELVKANQNLEHRVYNLEKTIIQLNKVLDALATVVLGEDKPRRNAKKQNRK